MAQSMTGFGSAEKNGCRVEIRSLNNRFLDIYIKAPAFLSQFDIPFRNLLKERFARGKFDVTVSVSESISTDFKVNTDIAGRLYAAFKKLQGDLSLPGEIDINMITGFHQMYLETDLAYDADTVQEVFKQAMDSLAEMRNREGGMLAAELLSMLDFLTGMNNRIKDLKGNVVRELTGKFHERLKALFVEKDFDDNRILQEAALMAMKLDISEETARIDSHIKQFREILSHDDIIGRKLDFIVQELNREINTITSKSSDYALTGLTVEMKSVIEKIKEQVQNIQ
ncbi:MAG: YicC family protein [Nitrospira bacterium HGW-Nitrospira-1]|nr:MAG: YicC family protein [Nitrospira bacterium HGW-Nitrospira-1]